MNFVRAKKHLGQHFLNDENIARKIVSCLEGKHNNVLEVGPGTGMLTKHLLSRESIQLKVIEVDPESVAFLESKYPSLKDRIIHADFLKYDLKGIFDGPFAMIGNFPYNISGPILFKILEYRDSIPEVAGMLQKEVAVRINSAPGSKDYGILSVLLQAFYHIEYLFTVSENVFIPPPKVKSAVIRMSRNDTLKLPCREDLFFRIVKAGFNQRRKTLRNALSAFQFTEEFQQSGFASRRAEQLSVEDFVRLTLMAESA